MTTVWNNKNPRFFTGPGLSQLRFFYYQAWHTASQNPDLWTDIDLSKRMIDTSVAKSVNRLQPRILTLNMATSTTRSLELLLTGLTNCQVNQGHGYGINMSYYI